MKTILVTGGTGALGSAIVVQLSTTHNRTRIMSRQTKPTDLAATTEWAQADLLTGNGLEAAVTGVDIIVNCATSKYRNTQKTDVSGLQKLLAVALKAGVQHILHISIVGTDQLPLAYYRQKVATEEVVAASSVPHSIIRITQFHTLLDEMMTFLTGIRWLPFVPLPREAYVQLIDPDDVALYLLPLILSEPGGRLEDVGGPEILSFTDIAEQWLKIRGIRRPIVTIPLFGKLGLALKDGVNLQPANRFGTITWRDYLHRKYRDSEEENGRTRLSVQ